MIRTILALGLLLAAAVPAAAVDPDCAGYEPAEHNPVGRDRAVVLFHWACGMRLAKGCDFRANPALMTNKEALKDCLDGGPAGKLGAIAGHVLQWEINHGCEGNATCTQLHKNLCLGKADKLQQRRRLLRCSRKARNKLYGWTAEILQGKTGTNAQGQQDEFSHKFGAGLVQTASDLEETESGSTSAK